MLNPKKKRKECYFAGILAAAAAISLLSGCCGGTPSLEEALKKKKMTSKELCGYIGITEANLSILRSGKARGVRFNTLNKICYYLECNVEDILEFDGRR